MGITVFSLALEEENSAGVTTPEIEYVYYAKLTDEKILENLEYEDQEQWEIKIPVIDGAINMGRLRSRRTTKGSDVVYTQTLKVTDKSKQNTEGPKDDLETTIIGTKDLFNQFKLIAPNGMVKRRYFMPIPGTSLTWQIDRFYDVNGGFFEDVKIDLEVEHVMRTIFELPEGFSNVIMNQANARTPEEVARIQKLYDDVFLTKNPLFTR